MSDLVSVAVIAAVPGVLTALVGAFVPSRRLVERIARLEAKVDILLDERPRG